MIGRMAVGGLEHFLDTTSPLSRLDFYELFVSYTLTLTPLNGCGFCVDSARWAMYVILLFYVGLYRKMKG